MRYHEFKSHAHRFSNQPVKTDARGSPYNDLTLFDFTLFQYVKELMSKKGNGIVPETAIYNKV